jgi:hypothetical protein
VRTARTVNENGMLLSAGETSIDGDVLLGYADADPKAATAVETSIIVPPPPAPISTTLTPM